MATHELRSSLVVTRRKDTGKIVGATGLVSYAML